MLNKLSYNLMQELNDADTNAIEIKKKVFMEGSNVRVEEIPAEEANLEKQQINESEEAKGKEVLNELGTDSTIDKLIAGDELYFRNNDGLALMVRYADTYDQPEDYDEGYTQGWERGADEEFDKVQDENFAKAKQAAEEGNVWEVLEIDETTLQPNGSVYGYLYGQEELAKFLKEVREVRVVKRLEESKKVCEKCGKEVCECDKSINESGEDIKKDLNIEAGSDEEAELDNILDTNYNDLFDNLDDEEKEEYNKIAATIRDLKPEEALIDVIDEIKNKAKENGLEEDLLLFAYLNKRKINEAATDLPTEQSDEDRLASLKVQLAKDGDQLADDEKESIEKEIADLEAKLFPIDETDESKGKIKKSFEESVTQKDLPSNDKLSEEAKTEKEHRIMDGNKVIKKFKDNEFEKGYNEMRDMGKKLKADGKEDNLIYKTVTIKNINETGEWDNNDEDMQMWLEDLRDQAKELAAKVKGEVKSVTGFDAYQGPRAIVHTPKHGDIEMWYDLEDDRGLTFNCKVANAGWINGGINQLAEILNQDTIDDNEIISESEDTKPHKKADRQFIIALIKSGALDDIDTLEKEGGFEDAVDYWVNHYYDDYTDAELKDLDETAKSADDKLHEAEVSNLKTIKSQGNIFMLEDDNQYIVGENYNEPENIIENAEIYSTKEEADKDYFNRCGITLEESAEQDLNNKSTNLYDRCYHINNREELKEIALNAIYVANNDQKIIDELNDRLVDLEKEECHDYLVKFSEAPYDFVANNYTNIPLELLREIALNAVYVANNDEAIEKEIKDRIVEYDETYKTSEKDLSKDLFGSEAEKRQSEADRALEKYLDLAREIKAGNNDTITLDSAKQLLKNAYIKAKGYYSFEPEEIDRRIAKDIPDLFGDLEEGVISDLKATHLAKKAAKLSKEKDFGKSAKAFAKSMEINDKSANKLDNKAKKLEDKAGKLRNEAIVKRNKSVKDFTSKK